MRLAQHHLRAGRPGAAAERFEAVLLVEPERTSSREGLARAQAALGRPAVAADLLEAVLGKRPDAAELWVLLGHQRMALAETEAALTAFERAAELQGDTFRNALELGVLELAAGRPDRARDWLDRVGPEHPAYAMGLLKRAQVAVLLGEADRLERIERARDAADATTRPLLAAEPLFAGN
jgi:cytochrome c-type biogenesis protein CcmH/NrfG